MRQQGCRQCEQTTAGDCGQHGSLMIPLGTHNMRAEVSDWKDAEIVRLRAKVERLTERLSTESIPLPSQQYTDEILRLQRRVKALEKAISHIRKIVSPALIGQYECERLEAALRGGGTG